MAARLEQLDQIEHNAYLESALDVRDESAQSSSLNSQFFIASVINCLVTIMLATCVSILTIQPRMAESVTIGSLKMRTNVYNTLSILVHLKVSQVAELLIKQYSFEGMNAKLKCSVMVNTYDVKLWKN